MQPILWTFALYCFKCSLAVQQWSSGACIMQTVWHLWRYHIHCLVFHVHVFTTGKAPPNLPPGVPPLLPNPYIMAPGLLHAYPVGPSSGRCQCSPLFLPHYGDANMCFWHTLVFPPQPQVYGYDDLQMLQTRIPLVSLVWPTVVTFLFLMACSKKLIPLSSRITTASLLQLPRRHWPAETAAWRATLTLVRPPTGWLPHPNYHTFQAPAASNRLLMLRTCRRLIKVWSRGRVVPGSGHHLSADATEPNPNASHHTAALPQPCAAPGLQLHQSAVLHWDAGPAQYVPVRTCCVSGENKNVSSVTS